MTLRILSLTFNDLTSLNRAKPGIVTSKSETDPIKDKIQLLFLNWRRFSIHKLTNVANA